MTPKERQEKEDAFLTEAKELSYQQNVLLEDIKWTKNRIDDLEAKVTACTYKEEAIIFQPELNSIIRRTQINKDAQERIKIWEKDLQKRINTFYNYKLW